jgi:hypothetical protein
MAEASILVTDASGPLYNPGNDEDLRNPVRRAVDAPSAHAPDW